MGSKDPEAAAAKKKEEDDAKRKEEEDAKNESSELAKEDSDSKAGGDDGELENTPADSGQDFFVQWQDVSQRIDASLQACLDCAPPSRRRNVAVLIREGKYSKKHAKAALMIQTRFRGIRDRTEVWNKQQLKTFLDSIHREKQLRHLGGYDPVKSKVRCA
mmetsp:Transcript_42205/g.99005  ORF Transcript_42205/g.99005 Transcript_42205/m.99005 type:complete len:160 (-) Transcript_42205:635-1114(-)|eukprot:2573014-Rhodomonas_salina.1